MKSKTKFSIFEIYNLKYNKNNKKSFIFNIITIAVGLAVFLTIQIINLVNKNEINNISYKKVGGDIGIIFKDNIIEDNELNILNKMKNNNYIEYTKSIWSPGTISAAKRNSMCIIRYINPTDYQQYKFDSDKTDYSKLLKENSAIISKRLATSLNVEEGDKIKFQGVESNNSYEYEIIDIVVDDGEESMDMNIYGYIFVNDRVLDLPLDKENIASKIYIKNINENKNTIKYIKDTFLNEKVQLVDDEINSLSKELEGSSAVYTIMGILAIIISFVGIISSSILMIIKRQKDICVLKIFGATNLKISILFLGEMLYTTLLGVLSGLITGVILSYIVCYFVFDNFYNIIMINGIAVTFIKVFLIGMSSGAIFGTIPVILTLQFKPITILRDKTLQTEMKNWPLVLCVISIILLFGGMFSLYLSSITGLFIIIMIMLGVLILYLLSRIFLELFTLSIFRKRSINRIALKSMMKDGRKFSLVIMTISISVAVVGSVLLMYNSILPSLEKQVEGSLGYNAMFKVNRNKEESINLALKEAKIKDFYVSSIVDFNIVKVNGKLVKQLDDYDYSIDCMHDNMDYVNKKISSGVGLDSKSTNNDIVLDEEFYNQYQMNIGDIVTVSINNKEYDFNIVGVRSTDKIKTGQAYVNYESMKDIINHDFLRYYIITDDVNRFILYINNKFNDIVVLDIEDISRPYAETLNKQMMLLKMISLLCIGSSILLIFNILSITYIGKQKEFLVLGMYGAEKNLKRKIIITQGLRLGMASSILAFILSVLVAIILEGTIGIAINYDLLTGVEVLLLSIGCSLFSVLIISINVVNYKKYSMLRID